jgi:hypothetical protein
MELRDFVTFDANSPDDAEWDQNENLVIPGGRAVAQALTRGLQDKQLSCSPVVQHGDYGWEFEINVAKGRVWCVLAQAEDRWLLILEEKKSLIGRMFGSGHGSVFGEIQGKIHETLSSDTRFTNILWFTRADYEAGKNDRGTDTPTPG